MRFASRAIKPMTATRPTTPCLNKCLCVQELQVNLADTALRGRREVTTPNSSRAGEPCTPKLPERRHLRNLFVTRPVRARVLSKRRRWHGRRPRRRAVQPANTRFPAVHSEDGRNKECSVVTGRGSPRLRKVPRGRAHSSASFLRRSLCLGFFTEPGRGRSAVSFFSRDSRTGSRARRAPSSGPKIG